MTEFAFNDTTGDIDYDANRARFDSETMEEFLSQNQISKAPARKNRVLVCMILFDTPQNYILLVRSIQHQ